MSLRRRTCTLECKHSCYLLFETGPVGGRRRFCKLVDAPGTAPGSSVLQTDADLSQLNVQKKIGGTERTRTVIVFLDREVHTPFCHGP